MAFGGAVIIQRAQFIKLHWAPPPHVSCSNSIDGNPICMLPFPSDRLLHESNHTVTERVFDVERDLGVPLRTGKMLSFRGHHDDGSLPAVPDGFSSMTPIMAWMPGCELGEWPGRYYEDEAAGEGQFTAVIDVAANSSVAHAAFRHGKLLVLQPLDPLPANSRIAVGVKRGIRGEGTAGPSPQTFLRRRRPRQPWQGSDGTPRGSTWRGLFTPPARRLHWRRQGIEWKRP